MKATRLRPVVVTDLEIWTTVSHKILDWWSFVVLPRESVFSQESKPMKEQAHVSKIDEELEESDEEEVKGEEEEFAGS